MNHDLQQLLQSNYAPSTLQAAEVTAKLLQNQTTLLDLESKATRARAELEELESQIAAFTAESRKYRAVLGTVRLLPPEILQQVFCHLIPSLPLPSDPKRERVERPPFALALVCRTWRAVALSFPQLWSTLDIRVPSVDHKPTVWRREDAAGWEEGVRMIDDELTESVQFYSESYRSEGELAQQAVLGALCIEHTVGWVSSSIRRSGNQPLHFRFWAAPFAIQPLLDVLCKYSSRWYEAIFVETSMPLAQRVDHDPEILANLRKIAWSECQRPVTVNLLRADNLLAVGSEGCSASNPDTPWEQLTEYNHSPPRWYSLDEGFLEWSRLSNLVILRLNVAVSTREFPVVPLLMPHLRILCINYCNDYLNVRDLVDILDLPILQAFARVSVDETPSKLALMLPRSPHLKLLRLSLPQAKTLQSYEIQTALRMYPRLTELALDLPNKIRGSLIRDLTVLENARVLFPSLGTFCVSNRSLVYEDPLDEWTSMKSLVVSMLQARFGGNMHSSAAALRKFRLVDVTGHRADARRYEKLLWSAGRDVQDALRQLRAERGWDIKFGAECAFPRWDELTMDDL
ncbi:F-box domain-containing protein [Mycena chlorophos]|uniref:F-box domain-containing protein n=1 Tax=Mycena chlorophos TaxID=658473 RepID=A0A8H6SGN1_MYCCL|nr:F-box domain-containing protein [Mycena chlorophos]